jgi:uncharacterized membrane protein HdeD (DUF308 family)
MHAQLDSLVVQVSSELSRNWGWFLAFGIGLAILGIFGISQSVKATIASMNFFGWLLVIAGVIAVVNAFIVGSWNGFFVNLLVALFFGTFGFLMLTRPLASAEALTMVMAVCFVVLGIFEITAPLAAQMPGAGWWVLDGIVSLGLGILILAEWPFSGLWAIGLYIGITLIMHGFSWAMFALGLHRTAV